MLAATTTTTTTCQIALDLDPKVNFSSNCRVFGMWCVEFSANFGDVTIEKPKGAATPMTIGLSLSQCKELIPGKLRLQWNMVSGASTQRGWMRQEPKHHRQKEGTRVLGPNPWPACSQVPLTMSLMALGRDAMAGQNCRRPCPLWPLAEMFGTEQSRIKHPNDWIISLDLSVNFPCGAGSLNGSVKGHVLSIRFADQACNTLRTDRQPH